MRKKAEGIFEYNQEWFEYGFIDEEFVSLQLSHSKTEKHPDIEGYKWAAYCKILDEENFETEKRRLEFMDLVEKDPNEHLWKGAISILIDRGIFDSTWLRSHPDGRVSNWRLLHEKLKNTSGHESSSNH